MSEPSSENPTKQVVLQRIRNRIIEVLELASSFEQQRTHDMDPNELMNQWEDWVREPLERYGLPVFSVDEQHALRAFHRVWNATADATPKYLPPLAEMITFPAWEQLRLAARQALEVFAARGRFSEEQEVV